VPGDTAATAETDGRVQRGARNRGRIVAAVVELVRSGIPVPTAEQVAREAGVGARTVFRHFADMERLFAEVTASVVEEARPLFVAPLPDGSPEERARALVANRAVAYEHIAPFRRSATAIGFRSDFLQQHYAEFTRQMRAQLLDGVHELRDAPTEIIEAIDLLCSFEAWDRLRRIQQLEATRAAEVLASTIGPLVAAATGGGDPAGPLDE